ncbi:hypothetical protein [Paraburkholderia sp. GAS32]|uniref:hypothetical protein n=1 Tax=Paraburkholderia sp. GAS32 TaxID=3035129 RepID=UPI003D1E5BD1
MEMLNELHVLSANEEAMEEAIQQFEGSSTGEALKCVLHAQRQVRSYFVAHAKAPPPAPVPSKWNCESPTEQGLYWHWTGDLDAKPLPLEVLYSGMTRTCFVAAGQYGIRLATDCDKYGGYWQKVIVPALDEGIGFHGSVA